MVHVFKHQPYVSANGAFDIQNVDKLKMHFLMMHVTLKWEQQNSELISKTRVF